VCPSFPHAAVCLVGLPLPLTAAIISMQFIGFVIVLRLRVVD